MKISEALIKLRDDLKLWCTNNFNKKLNKNVGIPNKLLGTDESGNIVTVTVEPERYTFNVNGLTATSIDVSNIIVKDRLYLILLKDIIEYDPMMFNYETGELQPGKTSFDLLCGHLLITDHQLGNNQEFAEKTYTICKNDDYTVGYSVTNNTLYFEGLKYIREEYTVHGYKVDIIRLT